MKPLLCFLCCFTFAQTQVTNKLYQQFDPNQIYFADNRPNGVSEVYNNNRERRPVGVSRYPNNKGNITPLPPSSEKYKDIVDSVSKNEGNNMYGGENDIIQAPIMERFDNVSFAVVDFGVKLMRNVNELQSGNNVVSPVSIMMLLALLQQGAAGATLEQITQALQMPPESSAAAYKKLADELQTRNTRNVLKIANNIFVSDSFILKSQFKKTAVNFFGSEVTPISFIFPNVAAQKINNWVATKTNNKITNLIASDALGVNSQMVLVNAMYYKGIWEIKFRPDSTLPREFHLSDGTKKYVPTLRARRLFRTGVDKSNNAQILVLPFEGEQYSLMVVLPSRRSNITELLSSLTSEQIARYNDFTAKEVDLELPKFTVKADTDLSVLLRKMGVTNLFGPFSELFGIGTYRTFSPQVSSAVHSAMLSVDEEGASAAAATAFAAVALSFDDSAIVYKANRPFLTVLWDNGAALPLFMAKIENP